MKLVVDNESVSFVEYIGDAHAIEKFTDQEERILNGIYNEIRNDD